MKEIEIKVCGITQPQQLQQLADLEIDFAGFIFYKPSPRYAGDKIEPADLKNVPGNIFKTGVFVNAGYEEVMSTVDDYQLNMVQLHGNEDPDLCDRIAAHVKVIKAFRLTGSEDLLTFLPAYNFADIFLFDTKSASYGGSGEKFDWTILNNTEIEKPFFLSGGIGPGDINAILQFAKNNTFNNTFGIDLNSRFETEAGVKDMQLLKDFVFELRQRQPLG